MMDSDRFLFVVYRRTENQAHTLYRFEELSSFYGLQKAVVYGIFLEGDIVIAKEYDGEIIRWIEIENLLSLT